MLRDRYVERDRLPNGGLSPLANPRDNYAEAQPARFQADLTDWAALSSSLTQALTTLELGGAAEKSEKGYTDFQQRLAKSLEEHDTLSEAFAAAISQGAAATDNPYFFRGYAQAAGQAFAGRYGMEGAANVATSYDESTKINPETGFPPIADATHNPVCIGKT